MRRFQICAAEKDFALLEKLQKNVPSVRLRRPCRHCEDGAVNITAKLLKARSETPDMPKVSCVFLLICLLDKLSGEVKGAFIHKLCGYA